MKLTPEAEKILKSQWVEPKKRGLGYRLKPGAPKEIRDKFNEIQRLVKGR